jgi:deoxyribodipyrimidine photo-lyase
MEHVSPQRVRQLGTAPVRADGDFVLYWMTSYRRGEWNFSLQRARDWARHLQKPLVVLEALRAGYRWASDRTHSFMLDGMVDNAAFFRRKPVTYYPYVEPSEDAGKGLVATLAARACVVVSDDFPCFFLPRMYQAAAQQIPVQFELVDSNGLLPMRAAGKVFSRAFDFRRFLQKNLVPHLDELPVADPLAGARLPKLGNIDPGITGRWPAADLAHFRGSETDWLRRLPVNHAVSVASLRGGRKAALRMLRNFVSVKLGLYATDRNQPQRDVTSGLSPYLHAGHIAAHEVFAEVTASVGWRASKVGQRASGSARGWWGVSEEVEAFLDQLITWRELGYNLCHQRDDYDQYHSLPNWSQRTLQEHERDRRDHLYSLEEFEDARTHDQLWNAAQSQLVTEGRIHNYLRMLWGKKILEWSPSPRDALHVLIELNNKYALDGRNPNSYSGIFWCLGRYDRAWGPERPVFGKVRFMSSQNTARKVRVRQYIEQYTDSRAAT